MKIGLVTACYMPVLNGVTRSVMLYKSHLERLGHAVTVFTLGPRTAISDAEGVVWSRGVPLGKTGYYVAPGYAPAARQLLAQMDIVHCHHLYMSLEFGRKYAAPTAPVVYTNHTRYDLYTTAYLHVPQWMSDAFHRWIWPRRTALADAVIAPSAELRDLMHRFGVRAPIHVIENGIDVARYAHPRRRVHQREWGIAPDAVVGIYVGRLSAEKRIDDLLRQAATAMQRVPALRLVLVGPGPDRERAERLARRLRIGNRVQFVGPVSFDDVPGHLAAADFFITASRSEVHPLTILEALAAGLPIVAYDTSGIRATITDGCEGVLAADGDLADAVALVAGDRTFRGALSIAASRRAAQFDFGETSRRSLSLYDELCRTSSYPVPM